MQYFITNITANYFLFFGLIVLCLTSIIAYANAKNKFLKKLKVITTTYCFFLILSFGFVSNQFHNDPTFLVLDSDFETENEVGIQKFNFIEKVVDMISWMRK